MKAGAGILILALVIALVIVVPMLVIWALNVLFPVLAIPLTLKTWFATVILCGTVFARGSGGSRSS